MKQIKLLALKLINEEYLKPILSIISDTKKPLLSFSEHINNGGILFEDDYEINEELTKTIVILMNIEEIIKKKETKALDFEKKDLYNVLGDDIYKNKKSVMIEDISKPCYINLSYLEDREMSIWDKKINKFIFINYKFEFPLYDI